MDWVVEQLDDQEGEIEELSPLLAVDGLELGAENQDSLRWAMSLEQDLTLPGRVSVEHEVTFWSDHNHKEKELLLVFPLKSV